MRLLAVLVLLAQCFFACAQSWEVSVVDGGVIAHTKAISPDSGAMSVYCHPTLKVPFVSVLISAGKEEGKLSMHALFDSETGIKTDWLYRNGVASRPDPGFISQLMARNSVVLMALYLESEHTGNVVTQTYSLKNSSVAIDTALVPCINNEL